MNRRTFLKSLSLLPFFVFFKPKNKLTDREALAKFPMSKVQGKTIFVSSSGDDSNNGDVKTPVKTLGRAQELVNANTYGRIFII
jgi:hypothetical protein